MSGKKKQIGENAAIVLKYIAHRSRQHGKNISGKKWVRMDLDHIKKQYPYLGRTTVDENITRLAEFGCIKVGDFNSEQGRPCFDRTRWYHVPQKWMNKAEEELRYFDPALASQIGVPGAVIHFNFCELLGQRVEAGDECVVHLSIAATARLQSFSEDTVKRAIKKLVSECMIMQETGKPCHFRQVAGFLEGANPDEKVQIRTGKVQIRMRRVQIRTTIYIGNL